MYLSISVYTIGYFTLGTSKTLGPVVQSPISTNPGLTLNKTYRVNPGLVLSNRALNNRAQLTSSVLVTVTSIVHFGISMEIYHGEYSPGNVGHTR